MSAKERQLIDEMSLILVSMVEDFGSDRECIMALVHANFRAREINDHLDAARDIARDCRAGEAELWDRLMQAEQQEKSHDRRP